MPHFMHRPRFQVVLLVAMVSLTLLSTPGCDAKPATDTGNAAAADGKPAAEDGAEATAKAAASVLGKYENAHDKITLELREGGKAVMTDEGKSTEVTWEMDGSDKLVVHGQEGMNLLLRINSDSSLSDNMGLGSVFRKK